MSKFNKKIFYPFEDDENLNLLGAYDGLEKISDNLLIEPNEIIGISEYGITQGNFFGNFRNTISRSSQAIIASCVS